jgi:hypothetical protein|tara:strand:+ start:677 stop:898 length:222 start_codon:yes stop_codon:yes gene_type:complete
MTIATNITVHHASAVVVEAHTVVNKHGHVTKWLTFSIKNAEGVREQDFSVFDVELTDLVIKQDDALNMEEIAA